MRLSKPRYAVGDTIKDDNRNFTIIKHFVNERISNGKIIRTNAYECKCNICNYISVKMESDISRRGCPCCSNKVVVEGINDIPTTAPWMIPYFQGGYEEAKQYTKQSNKKIYPKCPDCGEVKKTIIKINNLYNKKSIGCACSYKGTSYPERFMMSILNQVDADYIWQFSPTWLQGKRFDFCIESLKLIIETDGRLGHGYYLWGKCVDLNETSKLVDNWKDQMAFKHGYYVIRIDCSKSTFDYIKKNILNSELLRFFDLSKIDFTKCEKQSLHNLCKDICLYWESHQWLTCKELADIFGCATYTITRYLKNGHKVGWCSYTVENAKEKSIQKLRLHYKNNKRKSIYDDIPVIAVDNKGRKFFFDSITQGSLKFGIRPSRIKDVCEHKKYYKTAGGYIWKYIDELNDEKSA